MSRAGAQAVRRARDQRRARALASRETVSDAHLSPSCPLRPENFERVAQGDRPLLACTCAWDESAGRSGETKNLDP